MKKICVFCSARDEVDQVYKDVASECGRIMAQKGVALVYGGSNSGLMAAVSNAATEQGGKVIGIYPKVLNDLEPLSAKISDPIFVETMGVRKDVMIYNSDSFLILPGGVGTLDEVFEVLTLKMLGALNKPVVFVNTNGYWDKLIDLIQHLADNKFTSPSIMQSFQVENTVEGALKALGVL